MKIKKEVKFELKLSTTDFYAIMEALKDSLKTYPESSIAFKECSELHKKMKTVWDEK